VYQNQGILEGIKQAKQSFNSATIQNNPPPVHVP